MTARSSLACRATSASSQVVSKNTSYTAADSNQLGLVDDLDRAMEIAKAVCDNYHNDYHPDDYHCCDCRVMGIVRYTIALSR